MVRPVSHFFELDAPARLVGTFKYGNIERARALNLFPWNVKNRFFTVKIEETPCPKFKREADSVSFHRVQANPGGNLVYVERRLAKRWASADLSIRPSR